MPKITELFAWVVADKDENDEGVPTINVGGMALPLMGADMNRSDSLRKYAQHVADQSGKPVKLIRCRQLETLETVHPKPPKDAN